ncbi:MAG: tetratricopeptide repeat protein [Phycisphaerales bacterium]
MKTKNITARSLALAALGLTGIAALSGCAGRHGAYTSAALKDSEQRLGAIKAGAEFETARQQFLSGDLDKSLKTIDTAISLAPAVAKSHVLRGRVLLELGEYEDAIDGLTEAIELDPSSVTAHFHMGVAFERINRWDDALAQYRTCAELDPNEARFLVAQADMLIEMKQRAEAQSILEAAMERFPNSGAVRRSLGSIALLEGMPELAARLLREARLLEPDDVGILEDLARAEMSAGRFADAEVALSDLLAESGMDARRDLMHMRVRCLIEMDRLVDARTALLSLTSDRAGQADRQAWLTLGRVALRLNDMPRLRVSAARLLALEPTKPDGRLLMAVWQRRRGDLDGSLRSINAALELAPREHEAWVMRSIVLGEMGRTADANAAIRTAQGLQSAATGSLAGVVDDSLDR